jgi:hypothetical protein
MSDLRAEQAALEASAWEALRAATDRIPRERWSEEGVLPGWTVSDLLWHVAGWIDRCSDALAALRAGAEPQDVSDGEVDELNAGFAAQARAMDTGAIWSGLVAARERTLAAWRELPNVGETAVEWFREETYEHYREHLPDLERFAG